MFVTARYYESAQQARDAVDDLKAEGFRSRSIALITPAAVADAEPEADAELQAGTRPDTSVSDAIRAGGLLGQYADFYAQNLQQGYSLVVVEPPFGATRLATQILERHGPLDIAHEPPYVEKPFVPLSEQAAPLSSALGWRVLSDNPAPFSEYWGFGTGSNGLSFLSRWFKPLTGAPFSLASKSGAGLLSRNPSPLSSLFGLPTKSGESGDRWTTSFGLPLLSSNAAPLSGKIGMPLLSRKRWLY